MRLYHATYSDRKGRTRTARKWALEFSWRERVRRITLFADRKASEEAAKRIVRLAELRAAGHLPDPDLARWIEQAPQSMRAYLSGLGIIDARRMAATKALAEHVEDFKSALAGKGNTIGHVELTIARLRRVLDGCGFRQWSEVSASEVQTFIGSLREDETATDGTLVRRGISQQTARYHLAVVGAFCRWMVRDRRATENPMDQVTMAKAEPSQARRALSTEEARWLLASTAKSPVRAGMSGTERSVLYRLALETGLRANELASLTRASFNLGESSATVTVEAGASKRRRRDTLPLRRDTANVLRDFLAAKMPGAQAFNILGKAARLKAFYDDLTDARAEWVKQAKDTTEAARRSADDFLRAIDGAGRRLDFHALRHSFITALAASGVHPKLAQQLARHSTVTLTLDRYTHAYHGAESDAVSALPDLGTGACESLRATGTADTSGSSAWRAAWRVEGAQGGDQRASNSPAGQRLQGADKARFAAGNTQPNNGEGEIRTPENPEALPDFKSGATSENPREIQAGSTALGALLGGIDRDQAAELCEVARAWPSLSPAMKAGVLAMIRAAQ